MSVSQNSNGQTVPATPELSVVLVVGGQRERAARALHSLIGQSFIDRMEVLLYDLGPEDCPPLPGSDHPRVRLTRLGPKSLLGHARRQGVHAAKAQVVSFMEEHCEMHPGWAETIVSAHREPWAAIGSALVCGNPNAGVSDQAFRMNYGIYSRPIGPRGPASSVPGQNSSYKRDLLLKYEPDLEEMLHADLLLQWKMKQDGHHLLYEPAVRLSHHNENTFRSLSVGVFYWNWCFANIRARVFHWTLLRRAIWITLAPLIPWVRLVRICRNFLLQREVSFLRFLGEIPFFIAINYCAAAGQTAGLIRPGARGIRKFSDFEMNEPRLSHAEFCR